MTITFDGMFDGGSVTAWQGLQANGTVDVPAAIRSPHCTIVTDPLGSGVNVCKLSLYSSDAKTIGSWRTELTRTTEEAIGARHWYYFEFLLKDWIIDPTGDEIIWQIHNVADAGDTAVCGPPLSLNIQGDRLRFIQSYDAAASTTSCVAAQSYIRLYDFPIVRDRWVSIGVDVTWHFGASGVLKIYKDRRLVFQESGKGNCYNDVTGNYEKMGPYHFAATWPAGISERHVWFKGSRIGDAASSHTEVTGVSSLETVGNFSGSGSR